jgi:exopolysaccharide biosynthesis polyprenyl glycosylphosphotransferase
MVSQRARGLQHTVLICQLLLVPVVMALVALFTFTVVVQIDWALLSRYPAYVLVAVVGLLFETFNRHHDGHGLAVWEQSFINQHRVTLRQTLYAIGALLVFLAATKDQVISRWFLLTLTVVLYPVLLASNYYLPPILARRLFRGMRAERNLLVGSASKLARIKGWLALKEIFGFRTVGLLCSDPIRFDQIDGFPCLGGLENLDEVIQREGITQVIVLELPRELELHRRMVETVEKAGVRLLILSNMDELLAHPVVYVEEGGLRFITLREEPLENPLNRAAKRALDIIVSVPIVIFVLPPIALFIWLVQRFQSPGALFYIQTRAGIQNQQFRILKFRTMHEDNPDVARQATEGDPRVYPFGRFLRKFSIDELPQFINVLNGDMSVAGPRPHLVEHNAQFAEQMSNYHIRTLVKPGITGLAQVRGFRGEARTPLEIARRLESDISYLENWRLALDISIIFRTAWQMIFPPRTAV